MELSQTALAMLLLGGIPAGVVLNFAYALTDIGAMAEGFVKKLIRNVKDFIFLLIAGLVSVLTVYYVNDGEFRYLVIVGMLCGFALSHLMLAKSIVKIRNAIARIAVVPLAWVWRITFGRLCARARSAALERSTHAKAEQLLMLASNGFENERRQKHGSG